MATDTMLAVVKTHPERGVDITRADIPRCRPHEVLVRLRATSVFRLASRLHAVTRSASRGCLGMSPMNRCRVLMVNGAHTPRRGDQMDNLSTADLTLSHDRRHILAVCAPAAAVSRQR